MIERHAPGIALAGVIQLAAFGFDAYLGVVGVSVDARRWMWGFLFCAMTTTWLRCPVWRTR